VTTITVHHDSGVETFIEAPGQLITWHIKDGCFQVRRGLRRDDGAVGSLVELSCFPIERVALFKVE